MERQQQHTLKKHPWPLFLLSLAFFGIVGYVVMHFSPLTNISLGSFQLSVIIPFFIALFVALYGLFAYFTISFLQALILTGGAISYLIMRYFGLSHPLFVILLLLIIISLEFALIKKK